MISQEAMFAHNRGLNQQDLLKRTGTYGCIDSNLMKNDNKILITVYYGRL